MITKKQASSSSSANDPCVDLVEGRIGKLASEAEALEKALVKLDTDHTETRTQIQDADKEYAALRKQERTALEVLESTWSSKDKVRKQEKIDAERSDKREEYKEKSAIVKELRRGVAKGYYGVKRSASTVSLNGSPSKMGKLDALNRSPNTMRASHVESRDLGPRIPKKKSTQSSSPSMSDDSEYDTKDETKPVVKSATTKNAKTGVKSDEMTDVKKEVKGEVKKE